jgi:hypothetical protein
MSYITIFQMRILIQEQIIIMNSAFLFLRFIQLIKRFA